MCLAQFGLLDLAHHVARQGLDNQELPRLLESRELVGKGGDAEPPISLETMLDLTAAAEVNGVKFDGVDLSTDPALESKRSKQGRVEQLADLDGLAAAQRVGE